MAEVEHQFIALRQKRPLSELHVFVPQTHVRELAERPSVLEQAEMAEDEHWLYMLWQKRPVVGVQAALPHEQSTELINAPLLLEQAFPREHVLLEESQ
tara:strand:- start:98 stop:391 length:294 start_codon:yes stop_codon:yes gene_type:complete